MSAWTLLLVALAVSADAFAVAVGKGLGMRRLDLRLALRLAVAFGLFQAAMPLLGWVLGARLAPYVTPVDHWLAFCILAGTGGQMLRAAWSDAPVEGDPHALGLRLLLALGLATSIDALAVGMSFAWTGAPVLPAVTLIGTTTMLLTFGGVLAGHRLGARLRRPAEAAGGVVLIGIGTRILLTHLAVV